MNLEAMEGYREKTDEVALRLSQLAVELKKADTDNRANHVLLNIKNLVAQHSSFIRETQKACRKISRKPG